MKCESLAGTQLKSQRTECTTALVCTILTKDFLLNTSPNLKGGHTHNHLKNCELRLMLSKKEIKALRKIMKREKKNG